MGKKAHGVQRPRTRCHEACGTNNTFLQRAHNRRIHRVAHAKIIGIDDQQTRISRVSQQPVRLAIYRRFHAVDGSKKGASRLTGARLNFAKWRI
jgi:hypothetical protein